MKTFFINLLCQTIQMVNAKKRRNNVIRNKIDILYTIKNLYGKELTLFSIIKIYIQSDFVHVINNSSF